MKILKAHLDLSSSAALDIAKKLTTVVDPADCPTPEGRAAAERLIAKFGRAKAQKAD